jgi:hypothetical protein
MICFLKLSSLVFPKKYNFYEMSNELIVKWCPNCVDWIDPREGLVKLDGYCATSTCSGY